MEVGGVMVIPATDPAKRFSMFLWGPAKAGKTELAATAPGKILFLQVDPDGTAALAGRPEILVADLSAVEGLKLCDMGIKEDGFGLATAFTADPEIRTVVIDLTTYVAKALEAGVKKSVKHNATLFAPGIPGYNARKEYTLRMVKNLVAICTKFGKNIILIGHEQNKTDDSGANLGYTPMLSESLIGEIPLLLSEVWHISDNGRQRTIAVRPEKMRSPMGTRMFDTTAGSSFPWTYDAITGKGEGIRDWFDRWVKENKKISLPK